MPLSLRLFAALLTLTLFVARLAAQDETAPCTVSASTDTTPVHLGPGNNRAVAAFLPLNEPVAVIGQASVSDGLWYRVDKAQVAPNSSAAELWVAQASVQTSGGCENIPESAPPPLNPLPNAPTGAEQFSAATRIPPAGIIPAIGLWTLTMDARMTRTCQGVEGVVTVDTAEIYRQRQRTERLTIGPGNNNIVFRFDVLTRIDGTNIYYGEVNYEEVIGATIYVEMGSETFMYGKIDVTYIVDGYTCLATIPVIVEYNFPRIPGERGTIIYPTPLAP